MRALTSLCLGTPEATRAIGAHSQSFEKGADALFLHEVLLRMRGFFAPLLPAMLPLRSGGRRSHRGQALFDQVSFNFPVLEC